MPFLLNRMIDEAAQRRPESLAARCGSEELSYGELARRSNGLARVLHDSGIRPGDRVAVLLGKGLRVPVAFYGAMASGGALVPIDPGSPGEQVARILNASGARCIVTEPQRLPAVRQATAGEHAVTTIVGVEPAAELPGRCIPWTEVDEAATDQPPDVSVIELDPAYIIHTSGSTGLPKLILHTHRSAMSFVEWAVEEYGLTSNDRLSNHSSHHTCFATFDYYATARAGATTVILPPAELKMPVSLSALLERERISVWYSVPTALVQLSVRGALEERDLSSIRWVLFAGETFPEKHLRRLLEQLPRARFSHVYGSTEVNVCTSYHLPSSEIPAGALPIGKACGTCRTLVVDDDLQPVPDGGSGELLVQGATVMSGYWGDPKRSRESLVHLPSEPGLDRVYFRTGDHVRILEDGNLGYVARTDFQVKVRGHRVELEEVEAAMLRLEPVVEAAAIATPDAEGSSVILAAVVLRQPGGFDAREMLKALRSQLPLHAIPERIDPVPALPRTPTGKVDRNVLRDRLVSGGSRHAR